LFKDFRCFAALALAALSLPLAFLSYQQIARPLGPTLSHTHTHASGSDKCLPYKYAIEDKTSQSHKWKHSGTRSWSFHFPSNPPPRILYHPPLAIGCSLPLSLRSSFSFPSRCGSSQLLWGAHSQFNP